MLWLIVDALGAIVVGGLFGAVAIFVGVIGLALWAGWSRNRYCERMGWMDLSRWRT